MERETFEQMLYGLYVTLLEKEVVFGEPEAKPFILSILDTIDELDEFWNGHGDLLAREDELYEWIEEIREKYEG